MAFAQGRGNAWMLLGLLVAALQCWAASAETWKVGDASGWTIGPNYTSWAEGKSFAVGDILFFQYTEGAHDVLEVSEADYSSCTATSPLKSYTAANVNLTLNATGSSYYICGVPGHCSAGMKLAIDVVAASTPTTSPSPSPKTPPAPSPTTAPSPSPTSVSTPAPAPAPRSPAPSPTSPTPSPSSVSTPASGPSPSSPSTTTPSSASAPSPATPPAASTPPAPPTPAAPSSPPSSPPSSAQSLQVGAVVAFVLGFTLLVL